MTFVCMLYDGSSQSLDPAIIKQANALIRSMFLVKGDMLNSKSTLLVCAHVTYRQTRSELKEVRELAAFAEIETSKSWGNYIGWLITVPKFQGQGLATHIIQQLQGLYSTLSLHEDATNSKLKKFYENRGFKVVPGQDRIVPNDTPEGQLQHFMVWP